MTVRHTTPTTITNLCEGPSCQCEQAVRRAYGELRDDGLSEQRCLEAARIVFRHHHPEFGEKDIEQSISMWLRRGVLH